MNSLAVAIVDDAIDDGDVDSDGRTTESLSFCIATTSFISTTLSIA